MLFVYFLFIFFICFILFYLFFLGGGSKQSTRSSYLPDGFSPSGFILVGKRLASCRRIHGGPVTYPNTAKLRRKKDSDSPSDP